MTTHKKIMQALVDTYGLDVQNVQLFYNGVSKLFKINTDEKTLILKAFQKNLRTSDEITYERKILTYLSANAILCSRPIEPITSGEEAIFFYKGLEYYGILMHEENGKNIDLINTDASQIFSFGKSLSQLHGVDLPDFKISYRSLTDPGELIKTLADQTYTPKCDLLPIINNLYDSFGGISYPPKNSTEMSICHGDAWPGNAMFFNGQCTLIDFEQSQASLPSFDVSTFLWWTLNHSRRDHALILWEAFKQGYGAGVDDILDNDISTLVKTNELRSLIFLYKNSELSEKAFAHLTLKSKWFTTILKPNLCAAEIWKLAP